MSVEVYVDSTLKIRGKGKKRSSSIDSMHHSEFYVIVSFIVFCWKMKTCLKLCGRLNFSDYRST